MESQIPEIVARFIAANIRSLEQLEILLLVASRVQEEWDAESVNNQIRSSTASVAERLEELTRLNLLHRSDGPRYRFNASSTDLAAIEALAREYKDRRVKIVELIYSQPQPTDPVRGFADAFKFRKDN